MFYITDFDPQYDFGMKKFDDFIRNKRKKIQEDVSDINVGYVNKTQVFEIALVGIKKENITVTSNGYVVEVNATYIKDTDINYVLNKLALKDIKKKISLVNEYIGGAVRWKYENGLLTIAVEPYQTPTGSLEPSESDNFFNETEDETETNIP